MGKKEILIIIGLVILSLVVGVTIGKMRDQSAKKDVTSPQVTHQDKAQEAAQPQIDQPSEQYDYTVQIQRVLKERPNDPKAFAGAGDIYFEQRKFIDAIEYYKKAIDMDPHDIDTYNDIGLSYHYIGRSDEGLKYVEEGIKRNPAYQRIWLTKGFILAIRGDIAGARSAWEKAYRLNPNTDIGRSAASFLEQYKVVAK